MSCKGCSKEESRKPGLSIAEVFSPQFLVMFSITCTIVSVSVFILTLYIAQLR